MHWKDNLFNSITEARTSKQAKKDSEAALKLAKTLPETPPQHKRVVRGQFGTKEHYKKRGARLAALGKGREYQELKQKLKDRLAKAKEMGVSPLSPIAPDLIQKHKDLTKDEDA